MTNENQKPSIQLSFDKQGRVTNIVMRMTARDFRKSVDTLREYLEVE